ncbi:hypothetical protein FRC17_003799 [Serendipita sp. 399]|nr:hypothetical protein FRC17_003799 [Serendipita sp. 399]
MATPDLVLVKSSPNPPNPQYQVSTSFPDGKGDITLLTVDGVVFNVHRAVLQHSSPIFETIFEAGSVKTETEEVKPQLKVEADAATLDIILRYIYPSMRSPTIEDVDILASVFRAAKRYEMDGIQYQLRRELLEMRIVRQKIVPPFYIRQPFAVLIIMHAFECYDEARLALHECLKGDMKVHMEGASTLDIPVPLMSTILRLREHNASWFRAKLDEIPWPSPSCHLCYLMHAIWRRALERDIMLELDFDVLKEEVETSGKCGSGHECLKTMPPDKLSSWLEEWKERQDTLPILFEDSST